MAVRVSPTARTLRFQSRYPTTSESAAAYPIAPHTFQSTVRKSTRNKSGIPAAMMPGVPVYVVQAVIRRGERLSTRRRPTV